MSFDAATIDRIVANVLSQIGSTPAARDDALIRDVTPVVDAPAPRPSPAPLRLDEAVITADILERKATGTSVVEVGKKAVITPAARDTARERGIEIIRTGESTRSNAHPKADAVRPDAKPGSPSALVCVVRHTDAVDRVVDDVLPGAKKELLGCPDDAAKLAISAICRGETGQVLIVAEQTHRAACLANRNDKVKAVAVRDVLDVKAIRKQLRANVWCIDPTDMSWFELRQLIRSIDL
ncbi:hypothetical protein Mal4_37610 [Maioricimonas rarisocia]|uniref:Uncharacterized protein n=1 Tax=Maioricimonas rarisocia TaxID=2528026 RepID=A0A517ZAA9_9PLAN|nr:hypothetical protein [Maioricimonas rarisocia]QDU39416.1 hypothetical protein Mal4_37610 [Maioricimonas rarisocia]